MKYLQRWKEEGIHIYISINVNNGLKPECLINSAADKASAPGEDDEIQLTLSCKW